MTNRTQLIQYLPSATIAMVLTLLGCAADPSPDGLDPAAQQDPTAVDPGDEGIPGEVPDPRSVDKARNCSYVQWCDEPNSPRGTVCRVYAGCPVNEVTVEAYWQECKRDVRAICGEPVDEFWFFPW